MALLVIGFTLLLVNAAGAGKKPLFDYADHYVMLNDFGRNNFYRAALASAMPRCSGCRVLDLGAGSGLLAMLAAEYGAQQVVALEANPALAELANKTVEANRGLWPPDTEISVLAQLSSHLEKTTGASELFDVLVTETFGTMLLGESALSFVSDARKRLLKPSGHIIPAGGCQYATLVQLQDLSPWHPRPWRGFNLSRLTDLQDTIYWKAMFGASDFGLERLSERRCVLEVDLQHMSPDDIPKNRTYRIQAQKSGVIHAVLFDWDIWADPQKKEVLSTAPGSRNFAGDVAWGWLLQLQEAAGENWQFGDSPQQLRVEAGQWLEMVVEYIAHGVSMNVRVRHSPQGATFTSQDALPTLSSPSRILRPDRFAVKEANEFVLPIAGDHERHDFYAFAVEEAVRQLQQDNLTLLNLTLLDCSSNAGMPGFWAANLGIKSLVMPRWDHIAGVLRQIAEESVIPRNHTAEVLAGDPREMFDILLPENKRANIVVMDPPGTPLHGLSPFALLPSIRKELLEANGLVVPGHACLEVALMESEELSQMFSIPGGHWHEVDLRVWNEEARKQGVLSQLVPYTKWLGSRSSLRFRWLSAPKCVYHVDLNTWPHGLPAKENFGLELRVEEEGLVHAIVARWAVFSGPRRLSADSRYLGRDLTWPHYVQVVAQPDTDPGLLEPVPTSKGLAKLQLSVRHGPAKDKCLQIT
ncbi:unnamed protein product [Durusdinium trenchii]|uniref:Protein arginine N-methyltransferase n=1 Tax=Durusdinium trenchii TaxID=1381693 RepID=A0ABP0NJ53_9DINO